MNAITNRLSSCVPTKVWIVEVRPDMMLRRPALAICLLRSKQLRSQNCLQLNLIVLRAEILR